MVLMLPVNALAAIILLLPRPGMTRWPLLLASILLVLGLATRLAASALLVMTLVVELTVPDGWPVHVTWAAMALGIMAWGPGRLSLDHWIGRRCG